MTMFRITWPTGVIERVERYELNTVEDFVRTLYGTADPRDWGAVVTMEERSFENAAHEAVIEERTGAGKAGPPVTEGPAGTEIQERRKGEEG